MGYSARRGFTNGKASGAARQAEMQAKIAQMQEQMAATQSNSAKMPQITLMFSIYRMFFAIYGVTLVSVTISIRIFFTAFGLDRTVTRITGDVVVLVGRNRLRDKPRPVRSFGPVNGKWAPHSRNLGSTHCLFPDDAAGILVNKDKAERTDFPCWESTFTDSAGKQIQLLLLPGRNIKQFISSYGIDSRKRIIIFGVPRENRRIA